MLRGVGLRCEKVKTHFIKSEKLNAVVNKKFTDSSKNILNVAVKRCSIKLDNNLQKE